MWTPQHPFPGRGQPRVRDLLLCVRLDSMDAVQAMNAMFGFAQNLSAKEG